MMMLLNVLYLTFAFASFCDAVPHLGDDSKSSEVIFGLQEDTTETIEVPVDAKEGEFQIPTVIKSSRLEISPRGAQGDLVSSRQSQNSNNYPNLNLGAEVSSVNNARLEIAPGVILSAQRGQLVNVVFLLINHGDAKYFYISVSEQGGYSDQVVFPNQPSQQVQFLNGLSEQQPYLRRNETRNLIVSLLVPQNIATGVNKTITLVAQPEGYGSTANALVRRFYFTVQDQRNIQADRTVPYCEVIEDTRSTQCVGVIDDPLNCRQKRWSGKFQFQDYDSGLRSLVGRDTFDYQIYDIYYSYTNFIIGSKLPAVFSFQTSCCINSYSVAGFDVAGNEAVCTGGAGATVKFGSLQIAITVIVIVLAVVIVVGIVVFFVVRRRRNAELAEMRASPQAR